MEVLTSIKLILQTQEEVDQLYAILNYAPIMAVIENDTWLSTRAALQKHRSTRFLKWHKKLESVLGTQAS